MYKKIKKCRICNSKKINFFFNLGKLPPANSLKKNINENIPLVPLGLVYCKKCETVQLSDTVNSKYLFSNYVWVTGTSNDAKKYAKKFSKNSLSKIKIKKKAFIFEIASNDGTFLKEFKVKGHRTLGIDPAKNIAKVANKKGINTIDSFFNLKMADKIKNKYGNPDLIIARNVIPHIENIHEVINGMSNLISDQGLVVIEFHYSKIIQKELHYDSIYHEHLFYFSIKTILKLFKKYSLFPQDIGTSPISGGSLVIYFSKKKKKYSKLLESYIIEEKKNKINSFKKWQLFAKKSKENSNNLIKIIKKIKKHNKIFGYGASARSSTLLNYSNIDFKELDFILDKNLLKNNKFTSGTNIKIFSPNKNIISKIRNEYKYCLILAWNFKKEIKSYLKKIKFRGKVIIPLPHKIQIDDI